MAGTVDGKRVYNTALRQEQARLTRERILDAARQALTRGTYSSVTMEDIAREAGVASQTVYSVFGTKLRLAQAIIDDGFHLDDVEGLVAEARESSDPEVSLRTAAKIARRYNQACADLLSVMRESGDPGLLARHHQMEERRFSDEAFLRATLERSGRLRAGTSPREALGVIWAMTGADWYTLLVFRRHWTPSRYEEWLSDALIDVLLEPS